MRTIELRSNTREKKISMPRRLQSEMYSREDKKAKAIIFGEDIDEKEFHQMTKSQFLKGYDNSDDIYDL